MVFSSRLGFPLHELGVRSGQRCPAGVAGWECQLAENKRRAYIQGHGQQWSGHPTTIVENEEDIYDAHDGWKKASPEEEHNVSGLQHALYVRCMRFHYYILYKYCWGNNAGQCYRFPLTKAYLFCFPSSFFSVQRDRPPELGC